MIQIIETKNDLIETIFDLIETKIELIETIFDLIETKIDLIETKNFNLIDTDNTQN